MNYLFSGQQCKEPPMLKDGTVECGKSLKPFRYCEASCNTNYAFAIPRPNVHSCGPEGSFNSNIQLDFKFESCSRE